MEWCETSFTADVPTDGRFQGVCAAKRSALS
jgi:hypothetical protein